MTVTQAQPSENWKWFFNGITALLFTGVVIIWWFYGDPTGVLYTRRLAWQVSLCLVLAISLSFINFKTERGRFSMASVINFSAMLVLPPLFMPLLALVLSVIYSFGNGSRRPLIHMIFFFCSYCYIYFAGGFAFRLVSGQDFERVTWVMLLGVILAFAAWVIVNYGSITLFNYLIRKPDPFFQLRNLSRDIPYQAIVMPLGLINSMMLVSYDYLLVVLWSLVLVSTGAVTNRLAQLQAQLLFQNEQLTRKKEELEEISRREQSVGKIIAQSAGRLGSIALDQSNTISQQFEQLHEISSILTELSQSAQQVADTASKVLYSAQQSLEEAQSGEEYLNSSLEALADLQIGMEGLVEQTDEMASETREVDRLTDLIQEIADETHLLAVNATIEASSAGEYGQRFAVVASEINQLATRARNSSQQVQKVVNRMRNAVASVLERIEQSRNQSRDAVKVLSDASLRTRQVIQATQRSTELSRLITSSTEEQRKGTVQAANNINLLLDIVEQSVRLSEKSRETAGQLDRLSANLKRDRVPRPPANGKEQKQESETQEPVLGTGDFATGNFSSSKA